MERKVSTLTILKRNVTFDVYLMNDIKKSKLFANETVFFYTWIKFMMVTTHFRLLISFLGHRSQRLQWPIVITRCPSSVVCRPLDNLHFQLLFQNRLMDFDETWHGWSTQGPLQVLLFFGQICPGRIQGGAKIGHVGSPSLTNFFFRPEGYRNKLNA